MSLEITKSQKKKDDRNKKILDSAEEMINNYGVQSLNIRQLALNTKLSVGSIYNSFDDINDIIMNVNSRTLAKLGGELKQSHESNLGNGSLDKLLSYADVYLNFCLDHSNLWMAVFDSNIDANNEVPDWYLKDHYKLFEFIREPLMGVCPNMTEMESFILARSLFSAVHGIIHLSRQERLRSIPNDVIREQVKIIVTAIVVGLEQK